MVYIYVYFFIVLYYRSKILTSYFIISCSDIFTHVNKLISLIAKKKKLDTQCLCSSLYYYFDGRGINCGLKSFAKHYKVVEFELGGPNPEPHIEANAYASVSKIPKSSFSIQFFLSAINEINYMFQFQPPSWLAFLKKHLRYNNHTHIL